MATTMISSIMAAFEKPLTNYIDTTASTVASALSGPIAIAATIYIAFTGYMIATGRTQSGLWEFVINCVKATIIVALASKADTYSYYVGKFFFTTIPNEMGALLGGGTPGDDIQTGTAFDTVMDNILNVGFNISKSAGTLDVGTQILGYSFGIVGTAIITLLSIVVLFAKVGIALIIGIGPIFIALSLFETTRGYTERWVALLANFTILQVLIFALFGLLLSIIDSAVKASAAAAGGGGSLAAAATGLCTFILALVVASQLPGMASSLAGSGLHLGSSMMGAALAGPRALQDAAGRGAVGAARGVGRGFAKAAKWATTRSNRISKD